MKRRVAEILRICLVAAAIVSTASAYKEVPPPENVVLPKPRSAAESLASIKVAPEFEVELVAAEPMVMDPIDLAWDADGRMWVVEMADYPLGMDGQGRPGGRIRVLESTRGDGKFDKATLFADGLRHPTSVLPWRNGVLVTAVPDILLLEDTDGNGRADRRTKVFTGLAEGNQQHLVNGLQWSLDGWLHMANGDSGGKITSTKTGRMLDVGRRDFRIQPDEGGVEFLTGQTQAGRNRDDWGNWFGCNNSNPIWHYALEERYLRRNPHFVPPSAVVSVGAVPGAAPVYPVSETIARFNDPHGRNHFTSACGVMVYRDDFLGPDYAGNAFVCEPVHNLVSRQVLRPAGATFKSTRAAGEETSEFFASTDNWSRFTAVRAGPDGALYIADMYRLVIEHPKWIPDAWQKVIGNVRAGEEQGRIYRVRPKGKALRPVPRLDRADAATLAAALEGPSGIVRDLAQQQLAWRGTAEREQVAGLVKRIALGAARAEARAQALWTLQTIGALTVDVVRQALDDAHPQVRRQAVRLSEEFAGRDEALLTRVIALGEDTDLSVRQQVAYTLGEWQDVRAGAALARLLRANDDRLVRAAAMSSALPHAETLIAELSASGRSDEPLVIEIATATNSAKALAAILTTIAASGASDDATKQFAALAQLLDWLQRNNKALGQLADGAGEMTKALAAADDVFARARVAVANEHAPLAQRVAATNVIGRGRSRQNEDVELLAGLLTPRSPIDLQLAAVAALGRMNRASVPDKLLADWGSYGPSVRAAVLRLVTSRAAWGQVLLDRVEKDRGMLAQIDVAQRAALTQHSNAKLAQRAAEVFGSGGDVDRQKVVDRYLGALKEMRGDASRGRAVFANVCSACHRFGDAAAGRLIGPDLTTVKDRSAPYLLAHILDPNRAVEDRYVLYTAAMQDGRALAGMLTAEATNSLTLVGLDGAEQSVLRSELRSLTSTGRSLMPEGLEAAIDEQAMADLIAFLAAGKE